MKIISRLLLAILLFSSAAHATLPSTNTRVQYNCDGATTTFAYDFTIYEDDDLDITKASPEGVESTLVLNTDYTVTGSGDVGGGNVVLTGTCEDTYTLTILRDIELTQDTDYVDGEFFSADALELPPDKLSMIAQQQQEQLDRTPKLAKSSAYATTGYTFPDPIAGRAVGWNSAGSDLTTYATSSVSVPQIDYIGNYADLATAVATIGSNPTTLMINTATTIADGVTVTIPSTMTLWFTDGGMVQGTAGGLTETLTINGGIDAGLVQIFDISDLDVDGSPKVKEVYPQWWGAVGDGIADDTAAIQAALDIGGVVKVTSGTYLISKNVGTYDRYGLNITIDNTHLVGVGLPVFRRYDNDISTYDKAFSILLIGVVDDNAASSTDNVKIEGISFLGANTNHGVSGNILTDNRYAIEIKNTRNTTITNCAFNDIDSSAILTQQPVSYNYVTSTYFNTTKNYNVSITGNVFNTVPHSVQGRAFIHAVVLSGTDTAMVRNNQFNWCDDGVSGGGTFDDPTGLESDLYTPTVTGWSFGDVRRSGRGWNISGNSFINSSEHGVYVRGTGVVIDSNVFSGETSVISLESQCKIISRNVTVSNNTFSNVSVSIAVAAPALNISITGNSIYVGKTGTSTGGVISLDATGLSSFIDAREWLTEYYAMSNISISNNSITFDDAVAASTDTEIGIRLYCPSTTDANYPENDFLSGISINCNIISKATHGIYIIGSYGKTINISENIINGKAFVSSGFDATTVLNSLSALSIYYTSTFISNEVSFSSNNITGVGKVFGIIGGTGTGISLPRAITGNRFTYINQIIADDYAALSIINNFTSNVGRYVLGDDWYTSTTHNNSIHNGVDSLSDCRSMKLWDGTNMRYYYDAIGSYHTY